ncbi:MAG: hemerythrin domain-containing protein [Candidatus Binataceae bacterium]
MLLKHLPGWPYENIITFFRECHVANMAKQPKSKMKSSEEIRPSPILLLLSDDQELANLVLGVVKRPWKLVRHDRDRYKIRKMFAQPNVRLVILDDQAVEENDRSWLLAQIPKHFSGSSLLYVASSQSDGNEKRARANGAQYYVSKPLSPDQFRDVLRSFLQVQQVKDQLIDSGEEKRPAMNEKESIAANGSRIDAGILRLSEELNREGSQLTSYLLDTALAGLRLTRNPQSRDLGRDAAQIWTVIEPILSHHLDAEDSQLLPWLDQQRGLSPEVGRKVRECHHRLRTLMDTIVSCGADCLTEAEAHDAGQAMSELAVSLDDAIDDEERRLFPTIQKALFASGRGA